MNITLLYGGRSGEHDVSLRSAASVYQHLNKEKHNVNCIGIDREGYWYYQASPRIIDGVFQMDCREEQQVMMSPGKGFSVSGKILETDCVLPILHGTFGEDGTLQGLLDMLNLPYAGSGIAGSYLGMDKEAAKILWKENGIPVVPGITVRRHQLDDLGSLNNELAEAAAKWGYPLYVKPVRTGSSVGVSRVDEEKQLIPAVQDALKYDTKILVEKGINGREIECSVIGNELPRSFPPGEIVPHHSFYSYEAKYTDPDGAALVIPADIPAEIRSDIQETAEKAYRITETRGLARVDFFLDKNDGSIYLNEINTIPGFTSISMFPKMCEAGGLPYAELLETLIDLALEEFKIRQELTYTW